MYCVWCPLRLEVVGFISYIILISRVYMMVTYLYSIASTFVSTCNILRFLSSHVIRFHYNQFGNFPSIVTANNIPCSGKIWQIWPKILSLGPFPHCFMLWDVPGSPSRTIFGGAYFPLIGGIISVRTSSSTVFLSPPSHFRKASDLASHVHSLALFLSLKERYTNAWVFSLIDTSKEPLL